MKKKFLLFPVFAALSLSSCSLLDWLTGSSSDASKVSTDSSLTTTETGATEHAGSNFDYTTPITVTKPSDITVEETSDEFQISTKKGGTYSLEDNIYTLLTAGTYTLSGKLEGQILVNAGDEDEVDIDLNGVSISYGLDSPIKVVNADKVEISAKADTGNIVKDTRSHKTVDSDQGEGAINAKCDLKLKGTGTLVVEGNYNNGVHTTKDLTIQKQTLKVTGYNNALKGKDSITIVSGTIQAYAQTGNGLKTENSDLKVKEDSSTVQRGIITVSGGSIYVDSLHDGVDASYDVIVEEIDSENAPTSLTVVTGKKSSFYSSSFVADSEKGLKAQNNIEVNGGKVIISASDDAIHANYGDELDNGSLGAGNITINGGEIKIASGDDGFHADNTLTVNDGTVYVTGSTEGLEGNYIIINGGETYVYGSDDGVNISSKNKALSDRYFLMNGGYLDVAVSNGDTDGIDSNGSFTLAGGIIITRGSPGTGEGMSTGLDVDKTVTMTGGTLIAFNGLESAPTVSSGVYYAGTSGANSSNQGGGPGGGGPGGGPGGGGGPRASSSGSQSYTFPAGKYSLKGEKVDISFINDFGYSKFCIYSSNVVNNATYTLSRENSTVKSWTQSSKSVTIS